MNRFAIAAVAVLALGTTTAASFQLLATATAGVDAQTGEPGVDVVAVDLDPTGNTATSVGTIESTADNVALNAPFQANITVEGVPTPGLFGVGFEIVFDPAIVSVTGAQPPTLVGQLLQYSGGTATPFGSAVLDEGSLRVDAIDLSGTDETGDGVVYVFDIECIATGASAIELTDTATEGGDNAGILNVIGVGSAFTVGTEIEGIVGCGVPAPATISTTISTTTPTSTPIPTSGTTAPGDTAVAVDVIPSGNSATALAATEDCAAADVDDRFIVDVVVKGVENLLAWEVSISYDPEVLQVEERDVNFFLAPEDGDSIIDTSGRVPDSTGRYSAGAVDTSDPATPDSGSGVLTRITLSAVGEGTSPISIQGYDIGGDPGIDRGVLLRNHEGDVIGDEDGDTFFDGPTADAEIRVGEACPDSSARIVTATGPGTGGVGGGPDGGGDDDGGSSLIWIILGVGALIVAGGGAAYLFMRRRSAPSL